MSEISQDTAAILVPHRLGRCADMDPLLERSSDGDEAWYLAVREQDGSSYGRGYWYTIEGRVFD